MRALDRVDHFLHPRPVAKVALVALAALLNLRDEVGDQVGVEERAPRFARAPARGIETLGNLQFLELNAVRRSDLDRLGDAELLDQAADDGALAAVEARLDAGVVADGDEAGLD